MSLIKSIYCFRSSSVKSSWVHLNKFLEVVHNFFHSTPQWHTRKESDQTYLELVYGLHFTDIKKHKNKGGRDRAAYNADVAGVRDDRDLFSEVLSRLLLFFVVLHFQFRFYTFCTCILIAYEKAVN